MLISVVVMGLAAFFSARYEINELYDAEIARNARIMMALMSHEIEVPHDSGAALHERIGDVGHTYEKELAVRMWIGEKLVYESESARHFGPQHVIAGFSNKSIEGQDWRFFVLPNPETDLTVEAAENYHVRQDIVQKIVFSIFAPALALLLLMPPLFWLGLRLGLGPLLRLSQEVEVRSPEDLTPIAEGRIPREILPLTHSINHLLARLGVALYQERRFTDLAAHELKTPLAVIKTLTQSAQRAPDMAALAPILSDLNTATDRATGMMMQLLAMARLDHAKLAEGEISVADACRQAAQELVPLALGKGLQLEVGDLPQATLSGHPDTLLLALRNLLDNAIKYSPEGGCVRLYASQQDGWLHICVSDEGPGIPADKLSHVAERFYRVPGNRAPGSGLGLAIASRAAVMLGGKLLLENRPKGLMATLQLPLGRHEP